MSLINLKTRAEQTELTGQTLAELREFFKKLDEPAYRAAQLFRGIYKHRFGEFGAFTELSKDLRQKLAATAVILRQRIKQIFYSQDGTRRYLIELHDGCEVESVWIPEPDRATICISS